MDEYIPTNRSRRWIAVLVIVVIVGSIAGFYFLRNTAQRTPPNVEQRQGSDAEGFKYPLDNTPLFPPVPPEDEQVYSYSGTISAIDTTGRKITLQTIRGAKTIVYTDATTYARTAKPTHDQLIQLTPEELAKLMNTEVPYEGSLTVGDTITAIASGNIRGQDTITAVRIILNK